MKKLKTYSEIINNCINELKKIDCYYNEKEIEDVENGILEIDEPEMFSAGLVIRELNKINFDKYFIKEILKSYVNWYEKNHEGVIVVDNNFLNKFINSEYLKKLY